MEKGETGTLTCAELEDEADEAPLVPDGDEGSSTYPYSESPFSTLPHFSSGHPGQSSVQPVVVVAGT